MADDGEGQSWRRRNSGASAGNGAVTVKAEAVGWGGAWRPCRAQSPPLPPTSLLGAHAHTPKPATLPPCPARSLLHHRCHRLHLQLLMFPTVSASPPCPRPWQQQPQPLQQRRNATRASARARTDNTNAHTTLGGGRQHGGKR